MVLQRSRKVTDVVLDSKVRFIKCPLALQSTSVILMFWVSQLFAGISISFLLILINFNYLLMVKFHKVKRKQAKILNGS